MNAELLALAGDSDSDAFNLLELAELCQDAADKPGGDAIALRMHQVINPAGGYSEAVPMLLEAVEAWHEFDTRCDSARALHGMSRDRVVSDVLAAVWSAANLGAPACRVCADRCNHANVMRPCAPGESVCASHLASTCGRCRIIHVTVAATQVVDGRGYCDDCHQRGAARLLSAVRTVA